MRATLTRYYTGDDGTFGDLVFDPVGGVSFQCKTVELPWRDDLPDRSCIPAWAGTCAERYSPKHGEDVYHLDPVPGRSLIELHAANWAGDQTLGFRCNLLGCVGVGAADEPVLGQRGVTESQATLRALVGFTQHQPFDLTVRWAAGVGPALAEEASCSST